MMPDLQCTITEALDCLDYAISTTKILGLCREQIEGHPEDLPDRLLWLLEQIEADLTCQHDELLYRLKAVQRSTNCLPAGGEVEGNGGK